MLDSDSFSGASGQSKQAIQGEGGGVSRKGKLAVVNFAVGNFAEPPGFCVSSPPPPAPPESRVCTAGMREIRREPGISRGKFRGQFETQNVPSESKVPRTPPPRPCSLATDPGRGGGGGEFGALDNPSQPTHIRKTFLREQNEIH